jgi:hypothetical protein
MLRTKLSRIMVCALIACLVIPALIHGTKRGGDATHNNPHVKLPPMLTIGPEADPYELSQREREKLQLVTQDYGIPPRPKYENMATITPTGEYTGMTDAELEKLQQVHRVKTNPVPLPGKESITTIKLIPRPPGIEGMTEAEKAKLEAWKKARRGSK